MCQAGAECSRVHSQWQLSLHKNCSYRALMFQKSRARAAGQWALESLPPHSPLDACSWPSLPSSCTCSEGCVCVRTVTVWGHVPSQAPHATEKAGLGWFPGGWFLPVPSLWNPPPPPGVMTPLTKAQGGCRVWVPHVCGAITPCPPEQRPVQSGHRSPVLLGVTRFLR